MPDISVMRLEVRATLAITGTVAAFPISGMPLAVAVAVAVAGAGASPR
jgi:hypothetical protein